MTTALQIIQRAFATSRDNDAGRVAEISGELLEVLNDAIEQAIADGALINPEFFGERTVVDFDEDVDGWPRPAEAEVVLRLEAGNATEATVPEDAEAALLDEGVEIADLPLDQRHMEQGQPAVYAFGQVWRPAGRVGDPSGGGLVVFATTNVEPLADVDDDLPAKYPRAGMARLKWELAIYLAQKDGGRESEIPAFTAQLDRATKRYLAFLAAESTTVVRNYGHGRPFPGTSPTVT